MNVEGISAGVRVFGENYFIKFVEALTGIGEAGPE
jgi:hypothetical protein